MRRLPRGGGFGGREFTEFISYTIHKLVLACIIVVCTPKPTIRRPQLGDLFNIIYFETRKKKRKEKTR